MPRFPILSTCLISGALAAANPTAAFDVQSAVKALHVNSRTALNIPPLKRDAKGRIARRSTRAKKVLNKIGVSNLVEWRLARRRVRMKAPPFTPFAPFSENDSPDKVVDSPQDMIWTLTEIEARGLLESRLETSPWSDDYWPYYKGALGSRYSDPSFPRSEDWKENYDYVNAPERTFSALWASQNAAAIDLLSPSEKYDALIGRVRGAPLTGAMWSVGEGYYDEQGAVEDWMGICDGWSAAAMMAPRPIRAVDVPTPDGQWVRLRPFDIKALNSLAWASGSYDSRFIGGRCNTKTPELDENGRVIDAECFNTNPGTWHLAVVNQLGVAKRSLIIDSLFDYEVWNQPVLAYQYHYFNPQTGAPTNTLNEATVSHEKFSNDKFRRYRNSTTSQFVGVSMELTYVVENEDPQPVDHDDPSLDLTETVTYLYDLELDANGKIIGGEWYVNAHPDFLWVPEQGGQVESIAEEEALGNWNGTSPIPPTWRRAAARAAREGQPLTRLLDVINQLAKYDELDPAPLKRLVKANAHK